MTREEELKKEVENIKCKCPLNQESQLNGCCNDCLDKIEIIEAELKGIQEERKRLKGRLSAIILFEPSPSSKGELIKWLLGKINEWEEQLPKEAQA